MSITLKGLLDRYRAESASEREKGDYFERLVRVWLQHAPTQQGLYSRVISYADWAGERFESKQDTGIDLCAELADAPGQWCGIQCRFYRHGHRFQLTEIATFLSATDREPFVRRVFVDTTGAEWTEHAQNAFFSSRQDSLRIGLQDLEDSGINWTAFAKSGEVELLAKKQPRDHQIEALQCVKDGLAAADRGKLIMACGTGKTFTALKIAEEMAGRGGRVLFLVPSLALMSQTVREWSIDSAIPLRSFAVCSDVQVGVRRSKSDDLGDIDQHDLEIPATTRANVIAARATANAPDKMTVVFSTYHSLAAIAEAQKNFGLPAFDLIICDEAHRTTGVTLAGEDESNFVKIHDGKYIIAKKRLYMTATPRVYGEAVTQAAQEQDATLCSMDDPALYGETLFTRNFGWAVQNGLLCDYKVIVLAVDESSVSSSIQARLSDEKSELKLDDATKLVGCYKALLKDGAAPDVGGDIQPMRRAIAFARSIEASKMVAAEFATVASQWRAAIPADLADPLPDLDINVCHVDGTFNAKTRDELLAWIKEDTGRTDECRILTNARCLSEGVDVPTLDGILFLHPRKSQVDVVQAVGRVMRTAPGKRMGYVILPVGVPAGMEPEEVLNNNERYKVIWQILNALRSHDERLDGTINKIGLGVDPGGRIEIIPVTNTMPSRSEPKAQGMGIGHGSEGGEGTEPGNSQLKPALPIQTTFQFDEFSRALLARIVKKCGTRTYWEDWARDVARIAEIHITRIRAAVSVEGSEEGTAFAAFLAEIRDDLNDSISADEAIEMLAQHMITKPVFDALFEGYSFAANNPVSKTLEGVLGVLDKQHLAKEAEGLERFYNSIRVRAAGITDAAAKQKIVIELYDKFFRNAFPKMTERLGIVYTPVEVVDFIIHSVNEVLQSEFGQTLGSKGVHIMDPFTGTGTFITRLLQSGLIKPEELEHKYRHEIHANEIVLLAYYIAAINIEATYHSLTGGTYLPFEGICLTDTFQLYEQERDLISDLMTDNSNRRTRQKELDIRVIVGNPPYSVGQGSANDNAANVAYPKLDERIRATYAARSSATNKNALYDSYIRAIRWASDRIGDAGVVAYVSNAGWLDANTADGLRLCLAEEFASIHVFHLRGNQRTSGERSRREGGKIFGSGSRTPVAIALLVKNPGAAKHGQIHFHDIGDYLTQAEKLAIIARFGSIGGIGRIKGWQNINPDHHGDWLGQRDNAFDAFLPLGDKDSKTSPALFANYSRGVETGRDAWCFNSSHNATAANMRAMIAFYNAERARFDAAHPSATRKVRGEAVDGFLENDPAKISWTSSLKADLVAAKDITFADKFLAPSLYRPYTRQWFYYSADTVHRVGQMSRIFPDAAAINRVIMLKARPIEGGQLALMVNCIPELQTDGGTQCFPRYLYDVEAEPTGGDLQAALFAAAPATKGGRRDAITDEGLAHFQAAYPGEAITKDDLFHYVYGLLHSEDYRTRFADNLSKQLPRIPAVKQAADFWAFVTAGRSLGDLHCDFDSAAPYPVNVAQGDLRLATIADPEKFYRVEKMKFAGKRPNLDKTSIIYNYNITVTGIPLEAYDYVVNGKPAIEWVMERQCVKTDAASGIVNDSNRYAIETVGDPAYPFMLLCRVITVSLETMKIVRGLPPLDIPGNLTNVETAAAAAVTTPVSAPKAKPGFAPVSASMASAIQAEVSDIRKQHDGD